MTNHKALSLSNLERQNQIYSIIKAQERIEIDQLCDMFSVSRSTARRDLDELAERRLVERFHGGAVYRTNNIDGDLPIPNRSKVQALEKKRIGIAAANLVQDGDTIFLASGTTVLEVARNLRNFKNLQVITNSLPVLNLLSDNSDINIVCLGGVLRRSELSFTGHIAETALGEIRVDKVILGIYALNLNDGITHCFVQETMTDRFIINSGRQIIVVADHTKLNRSATAIVAPISRIDTLVTGHEAELEFIQTLTNQGVNVIQV